MQETIRKAGVHPQKDLPLHPWEMDTASTPIQPLNVDEALAAWDEDKWETQEASNRAALAKEIGAVPWSGFNTFATPKTPPVSKVEREAALKKWLDEPLQQLATNVPAEHRPENPAEKSEPAVLSKTTPAAAPVFNQRSNSEVSQRETPPTPAEVVEEAIREASTVSGSRRRPSRELNYRCRGYKTNDALANCNGINDKVRSTLAIINGLMSDKGFCYSSDEQLGIWMHMSARGAKNLLDKLCKQGFIIHIGWSGSNIKRVVRPDLSNNPERTNKLIEDTTVRL
jgi:hypothetical protein